MFNTDFVVRYYRTTKNGHVRRYCKVFCFQRTAYKYYQIKANELGSENVIMYRRETTVEKPAFTSLDGVFYPAVEHVQVYYLR